MISLLLSLAITPAFADDTVQTTRTGGQENVNAIGSLYAAQQAAEARAAAAERRVAELERRAVVSTTPTAPVVAPAAKPATATPPARSEPVVTTPRPVEPDPELEQAKREAADAKVAYERAQAAYEQAQAELESATALELEVRTSGFRPLVYVGGAVAITESYEPAYGTGSGRVVLGLRPAMAMVGASELGIDLEANLTPVMGVGTGWGIRAVPMYIASLDAVDLGIGAGPSYDCSVLLPERGGCMAEHFGGMARGTLLAGNGVGVRLNLDVGVNYLTVSDELEVVTTLGASVFLGKRHPKTVTIE